MASNADQQKWRRMRISTVSNYSYWLVNASKHMIAFARLSDWFSKTKTKPMFAFGFARTSDCSDMVVPDWLCDCFSFGFRQSFENGSSHSKHKQICNCMALFTWMTLKDERQLLFYKVPHFGYTLNPKENCSSVERNSLVHIYSMQA